MALLIKWNLEIIEVAQVFPDHLKENLSHAAQQDFIPVHPFPQNALRNAMQKNRRNSRESGISQN